MTMKKGTFLLAIVATCVFGAVANADIVLYEFEFTALDLMRSWDGNVVAGADGSSAADNDLYHGAAAVGHPSGSEGAARSYVGSQNADFLTRVSNTSKRLVDFNLWGFDNPQPNQGSSWGDDYKPLNWANGVGATPTSWVNSLTTYPWGTPPGDSLQDKLRGWYTGTWADGYNWNDAGLADHTFKFRMELDTNDAFYGNDTVGTGLEAAPNSADLNGAEITFWFGGYMLTEDQFNNDDYSLNGYWQTNLVLQGTVVPAPGAVLLGMMGLGAVNYFRRKFV